ncbi:MAG: hypothetical protein ACI82S_002336 [Patiriisocius sp.]|jgi:hypothetical protein
MTFTKHFILSGICLGLMPALFASASYADTVHQAISSGKAYGNLNLRYENVSQNNVRQDASALTLRTRLGYTSGSFKGWSFNIEFEDSRIVLGQGDYSVDPAGYNPGIYSVIADPETTELDQAYVQYKNDFVTFKVGRQVIALDGHRFIGHVGWRQDRQTFDATTFTYHPNDKISASYSNVTQRNRIFGEAQDVDAKDHLFNASYKTSFGKFVGYAYLLEVDNEVTHALDTYGVSFNGKSGDKDFTWLYHFEYAIQSSQSATNDFDAPYIAAKLGAGVKEYTVHLGYAVLGSDNGQFGFSTPLATLHKFNGWADVFLSTPAQGLVDLNVSLSTKALGGSWLFVYHNYSADNATAVVDDLGAEINAQYTTTINKKYGVGFKYANYSGESGRPDTDKIWLWVNTKF